MLALALFVCALSCGRAQDDPSGGAAAGGTTSEAVEPERVPVHVAAPQKGAISSYIQVSTTVVAEEEADVYSKAIGLCKDVLVEEGDKVSTGDLLALLEDDDLRITARQAALRLDKAREDHQRAIEMAAEELISTKALDDARFALDLAEADAKLAGRALENTRIRAPIDGVIVERNLKPADLAASTSKLFRMVDLRSLSAVVYVPEKEAGSVRVGQTVEVLADSLPDRTFSGRVERINPVVDPKSGTVKVTIELTDKGDLKPGLFIRARIVTDTHQDALLVPKAALLLEGDSRKVFVIEDGAAREVFVEIGFSEVEKVEILHGIDPEDRIVVLGHLGLKDGSGVKIID